ncbi:uncharacterized protein LOC124275640 [Haliotis rubra]|uniref:uncharacterized protein LOC124275640 n=1 Tax=Haliotis rubra TaxID=36100 RepID=UPI001EE5A50B|nr:uncharacterized protein LOC124275640 [Haliotis rubra]XP_046567212.1 uncharacterized protein LOC124275640 [Haliotis rubra]XP_046567221.1 uncharacterized protein LOC124275640 [Haliotis rubra]XP_046567232.1 uncharacterized protein LOC124275640 [Haliotis rubra]XP_046567239.1 uncharacterized protein LOC124275640 [Haliotis rubra]XP_046567245.1 uncharacterized protein LOC124275640 [Haliotis rubra]
MGQEKQQRSELHRRRRQRNTERGKRAQIRKGLGACIFTLGIPLAIAGSIILIVANVKENAQAVPASFPVLGPVLLTVSIIFFAAGSILTDMIDIKPCVQSCFPDDPKAFCWKRCPMLFSLLRPNEVTLIHQREAGLHALQTEPSKPVLKKHTEVPSAPPARRGVRFSDTDGDAAPVRMSTSSDLSDNGKVENTSLLSLRHCKIYPKDSEKWGSMSSDPIVNEEGPENNDEVFTLSGSKAVDNDSVFVSPNDAVHTTDIDNSCDVPTDILVTQSHPNQDGEHEVLVMGSDHL